MATCKDANDQFFDRGSCPDNRMEPIVNSLPSLKNLDFIAMSQWLNGDAKGWVLGPTFDPQLGGADLPGQQVKPVYSWKTAMGRVKGKMPLAQVLVEAALIINADNTIAVMQKTNNWKYAAFKDYDTYLSQRTGLPQANFGWSAKYKTYMDDYVNFRNRASSRLLAPLLTTVGNDLNTAKNIVLNKVQAELDQWINLHAAMTSYYTGSGAGRNPTTASPPPSQTCFNNSDCNNYKCSSGNPFYAMAISKHRKRETPCIALGTCPGTDTDDETGDKDKDGDESSSTPAETTTKPPPEAMPTSFCACQNQHPGPSRTDNPPTSPRPPPEGFRMGCMTILTIVGITTTDTTHWLSSVLLLHKSTPILNNEADGQGAIHAAADHLSATTDTIELIPARNKCGSYFICSPPAPEVEITANDIPTFTNDFSLSLYFPPSDAFRIVHSVFEKQLEEYLEKNIKIQPVTNLMNAGKYGTLSGKVYSSDISWQIQELEWRSYLPGAEKYEADPLSIPNLNEWLETQHSDMSSQTPNSPTSTNTSPPPPSQIHPILTHIIDISSVPVGGSSNGHESGEIVAAQRERNWEKLLSQLCSIDTIEKEEVPLGLRNQRRIWALVDDLLDLSLEEQN
ncbi:MAG: hypothetical protein Q9213_007637 [Squamulea squamosa]